MEISFDEAFKKSFRKRIKNKAAEKDFWQRVDLFINDPFTPALRTHKLSCTLKGYWSFSIEYDLRVVFYFTSDKPKRAVFIDIGTHNEVY